MWLAVLISQKPEPSARRRGTTRLPRIGHRGVGMPRAGVGLGPVLYADVGAGIARGGGHGATVEHGQQPVELGLSRGSDRTGQPEPQDVRVPSANGPSGVWPSSVVADPNSETRKSSNSSWNGCGVPVAFS